MTALPSSRKSSAGETRRRLLRSGRPAFARKGLAGTNLKQDILEPAGVSVGSFYHQFRDKTELLLEILREHQSTFRARLSEIHRPAPGRDGLAIARDSYAMVLDMAERDEDLLRIQLRERMSEEPRVREFLAENQRSWLESLASDYARIARAGGIAEANFDQAAQLIVGLSLGAVAQYLELSKRERRASRDALLDGLVRFTLGGIGALVRPDTGVRS